MFDFGNFETAKADIRMDNDTVKSFWSGFCLDCARLDIKSGEPLTFVLGDTAAPQLCGDEEFAVCVNENGIGIRGTDFGGLMRGFFACLMKIDHECLKEGRERFKIPFCSFKSVYKLKNRMIHLCIFPESDIYFIKKCIRLAGVLQYTHVVLEFWGTLKYDCLNELAWPQAMSKQEAREIIKEIREAGMEPVPMFNQLGHATASRLVSGKHVVLEQNPGLQPLFTPDGWAWNIEAPEVRKFLREVRRELYELFGEGEYIHIGCDEAYYYTESDESRRGLAAYLSDLTNEVIAEGRRPMLWMDMLLPNTIGGGCYGVCRPEEADGLISSLAKGSVMVDWQYHVKEAPVPSIMYLKDKGYEVLGAPWYDCKNIGAHVETVLQNNLSGVMLTTWHTLSDYMPSVFQFAKLFGAVGFDWNGGTPHTVTASLLRRVSFEGNGYSESGWMQGQIKV